MAQLVSSRVLKSRPSSDLPKNSSRSSTERTNSASLDDSSWITYARADLAWCISAGTPAQAKRPPWTKCCKPFAKHHKRAKLMNSSCWCITRWLSLMREASGSVSSKKSQRRRQGLKFKEWLARLSTMKSSRSLWRKLWAGSRVESKAKRQQKKKKKRFA